MYYDPMISKLVTWGKDRAEALALLDRALGDYVIRGVTHNLGFGQSILRNADFASGNYNTAFIPTVYPDGFTGDHLDQADHHLLVVAAAEMKNLHRQFELLKDMEEPRDLDPELFVTLKAVGPDDSDAEYHVVVDGDFYTITNTASGDVKKLKMTDMDFIEHSLLRMKIDGEDNTLQFISVKDEIEYDFYYKGNTLPIMVHDPIQQQYKGFMAPPKKIDFAKSIISPMPGAIVSVSAEVGQQVSDGDEIMVIEAMKMQNVLKAEVDGKVKAVHVKPGDAVAVDELLLEFE